MRRSHNAKFLWLGFIAVLVVGMLIGYSVSSLLGKAKNSLKDLPMVEKIYQESSNHAENLHYDVVQNIYDERHNAITKAVAKASPGVVGINVTAIEEYTDPFFRFFEDDPFFRYFFGDRFKYRVPVRSLGSGFIISPDGYIVTNDHVVGNAKEIVVTLSTGEKYKARLVGRDPVSDIAVLKIDAKKNLPYLTLGNSDDVIIGEWAIAMGNPFGLFELGNKPTVTVGVISAVKMNLHSVEGRVYRDMIQTDAAINSGNSGGPLLNALGEVIGINTVIYTPNQGNVGVGFAIPINRAKAIIDELIKKGKIDRDFRVGMKVQTIDENLARYFNLPKAEGVIVTDVSPGSPSQRAGFKEGDLIVEVNGEPIKDEQSLIEIIKTAKVGDVLNFKVIRDGKTIGLKLKLEKS
ncbi:serine protease Do [Candidatus Kryptonium thompsonii]|uniref:Serine protease Do n=1 Tax=Candidatus Kryptonium thompsonii TaxID=1633631 RepID=A0A0P1MGC5_9BACT|nr:trypsin-like peptidase domain-containing protein [Candidatus Kryptonium thompsoni]CUS76797.1 serine protease Do [Candidatus Kryptonium thompsoni]CUS81325.1 serine protease Do [Candidatus Kryptonium thompsoni]CUS87341.1 serine protease Do [Candidatus Kryptonium thompsoni]CUS89130.1 serine protease Do [Candidatus Kryptonium thompsoni]CUS94137.1 serine protease Do [Candidatus Kryptonium thompsoni]